MSAAASIISAVGIFPTLANSSVLCLCSFLSLQSEMKLFGGDTVALKHHFGKKIQELEDEKRAVQV